VRPFLSERIAQAIAAEPIGHEPGNVTISIHLDRLAYRVGAPKHFDPVAVVPLPYTEEEARRNNGIVLMGGSLGQPTGLRAGRVVGVPGNRIQVSDGSLRIDGQPWAEPYIVPEFAASFSLPETVLGDADYLVLPEDRRLVASLKGEWVVKRHQIYGRLIVNKWPLGWWWFRGTVFGRPHPAAD
jgi:hypothetical protein